MSKRTKKCPGCGAQIPVEAKLCRKCQAKRDTQRSQRIETLPKPIRPEEVPSERTPKPVETARRPESIPHSRRKNSRNLGQLIAVLAVILVVIIVAVVLVVKMNQNTTTETSDTYNGVHIITQDGEEITPTEPPAADEDETPAEEPDEEQTEPVIASEVDPDSEEQTQQVAQDETADEDETQDEANVTAPTETVYVTGSGVNLRSGPSTTYDVVATLTRGTELVRTDTVDGWSQVEYQGEVCYVSSNLVSTQAPDDTADNDDNDDTTTTDAVSDDTAAASTDTVTVKSKANVRTGPGTGYSVVAILPVGTELERTGTSGNWSKVVYNGQEVYIHNNMISVNTSATSSSTSTTSVNVTTSSGTLTIASKANIRSGPGTSFDILGVADVGTTLTITGVTNTNWYQVTYNDQTGYVAGNLVTKD